MKSLTRRAFLTQSLRSAAVLTTTTSMALNMGLSQGVLAQSSSRFDDYKALVCVFLYGGNDSLNMLVPTDNAEYQTYAQVRQSLAYPQQSLLPLTLQSQAPYSVGMPSAAAGLHQLFEQRQLSVVANMGTLSQPLTKSMIENDLTVLPPQLFSHNDQQSLWQSSSMNTTSATGWAGRMADLVADSQDPLSMNLSLFGNNLLQSGTQIQPFSVDTAGPETLLALDPEQRWNQERIVAFDKMLQQSSSPMELAFANKIQSAQTNNARLLQAIENTDTSTVDYPLGNDLAAQLEMVARLIASKPILGQQRQVFFVGIGGWDTHDAQVDLHPQLLSQLGDALLAFQQDIDSRGLADSVTTFTMSDFGRTLTSNGDGTDHGWGGHQLVMGGAVNGGHLFGAMPALELNSPDDVGDGRLLPTTSVDQYAAALADWFGLSSNELNAVFPNLYRFDSNALSLFRA